jgi:hypothetical protein
MRNQNSLKSIGFLAADENGFQASGRLGDSERLASSTVARMGEGMIEDRGRDLGRHMVRVGYLRAGQPVDQAIRPIGLDVPPDFIE